MLPIYLSIEGLYSYQGKQEIDFSILTEAGLFGIFGNVGSGKSSVLEAISFALYGETERLNKQEKRTYNMLNLKSGAATIVFEFINFEQRKFRFVAQWKRRKKFEDITSLERYAYEWVDGDWTPLASSDATEVTRLSYQNFRRTIIIPQGQFKEFLELRGKDRSEMMKEIFNLNRFDLGPKTAYLQRRNNSKIESIKGALSGFETVSKEILLQKQDELARAQSQFSVLREESIIVEKELQRLTDCRKIRAELTAKTTELAGYQKEEPKIIAQEQELQVYETATNTFREILSHTQSLNKDKEQLTYKIEQLTAKKQQILSLLEAQEAEWAKIASDYQSLDKFRIESEDLRLLAFIVKQHEQKKALSKRLEDGRPHLLQAQTEEKNLTNAILLKEAELDKLKLAKVDTTALLAIESWYHTDDNLLARIQELQQQNLTVQEEIAAATLEFERCNVPFDTWEDYLAEQENQFLHQLELQQSEETQLQVQLKLSEFVTNLHEGSPCPLCGSLQHPNHMVIHDFSARKKEILEKQKHIQEQLQRIKSNYQALTRASMTCKAKEFQLQQQLDSLSLVQLNRTHHAEQFIWKDFSIADRALFIAYKDQNLLRESTILQNEEELKRLRNDVLATQQKVEKYKAHLSEFEQNLVVIDSLCRQSESQLRILVLADYASQKESALIARKQQLENRITYLEDNHKTITEAINNLKTEFARISGERGAAKDQFQQLYQQLSAKQAEVSQLLKLHGYNDIIEVQQILQKQLPIEQIKKVIHDFRLYLQVLINHISDLQERSGNDGYDEQHYQETSLLSTNKRAQLEQQIRIVGALEKECAHLHVEFEKKEKLLEEFEKLASRKSNLTTLENLFRGSGFVNYVSSIHLLRLCEIANKRFHRLTKNNLSLAINDSNEFEVIDYLNNGYRRSVKTLSGGQSFQASLCLALALAESIQALNKADKNFFFIDEGFGTQDAESMNIVFETLQYLHRENRIVGIISHVEELKERIPRAITVVNDSEKGSVITYNG